MSIMNEPSTDYSLWQTSFALARKLILDFLVFLMAMVFFGGFLHAYYFRHLLGLPLNAITLPWQYTAAFSYPVIARVWWELLLLALAAWVLISTIGIGAGRVSKQSTWRFFAEATSMLGIALVIVGAIAVAFPALKHAAWDVARGEIIEACEGHATAISRIALRDDVMRALHASYGNDLQEFLAASSVVRYGSNPSVVLPTPGGTHAEIVAEDDREYDVLVTRSNRRECANMTLYRVPKSSVQFIRAYVSEP